MSQIGSPGDVSIQSEITAYGGSILSWHQGAIFPKEMALLLPELAASCGRNPDSFFILVSEECDVVRDSIIEEPFAELLCAEPLSEKKNGNYVGGRNPRLLHFDATIDGHSVPCSARGWDRHLVDRRILCQCSPHKKIMLLQESLDTVARWLSRRYDRPSFPDAFAARIPSAQQKKIRESVERLNISAAGLYVLGAEEELPTEKPYQIVIVLMMRVKDYADQPKRTAAIAHLGKIEQALSACAGISAKSKVFAEDEINVDEFRKMQPWDFDYLSYQPGSGAPKPTVI